MSNVKVLLSIGM